MMPPHLKILIIEDNPADAELLQRFLRKEGLQFESIVAQDKASFLHALDTQTFNLVLSDNSLYQFDATEAVQIIRNRLPDIPFILITGTINEESIVSILKLGIDDYILKDRLTRLPAAIEAAFKSKHAEKEKKLAEEELKRSEAKYRYLVERVSNGIYAMDTDWRILYMNRQAAQFFGCNAEELIGKKIWDEMPQLIGSAFYNAYHSAMVQQKEVHLEQYSTYFNKWVTVNAYPSPDGLVVYFRDTTSQKKAELEIQKKQQQYQTLIERVTDAFISVDKDFNYTFINQQAAELIRRDAASVIGKNVWEVFPDVIGSPTYHAFIRAMTEQVYVSNIDYYEPLDLWQENHIYPSPDGLSVFIRNITGQKRSERAAQQSEEVRNLIMNSAMDAIISIDEKGKINFWNKRAETMFGWSFDEIKDKTLTETIIPPKYGDKHSKGIERYLETGKAHIMGNVVEISAINRKKKEFPIELFIIPVKTSSASFFCAFIRDISERKKMEKKLLSQQRAAAREITATALEAQEKERNALGQELHDNINQILAGTKLMLQFVDTDYEKHRVFLTKGIENISKAIEENRKLAHEMVTPDLENENLVSLINSLAGDMFSLKGTQINILADNMEEGLLNKKHKLTLYRTVQEQFSNILKYAEANEVSVVLETADNLLTLKITDNGKGMDSTKKPTGIGLKNIISRLSIYNGSVTVHSEPEKGFALHVELPLEKPDM